MCAPLFNKETTTQILAHGKDSSANPCKIIIWKERRTRYSFPCIKYLQSYSSTLIDFSTRRIYDADKHTRLSIIRIPLSPILDLRQRTKMLRPSFCPHIRSFIRLWEASYRANSVYERTYLERIVFTLAFRGNGIVNRYSIPRYAARPPPRAKRVVTRRKPFAKIDG